MREGDNFTIRRNTRCFSGSDVVSGRERPQRDTREETPNFNAGHCVLVKMT
jgi:hypothetical protein